LLERLETAAASSSDSDELVAKAHALFILAENQYRFFTLVEKKETDFSKALTAKNESLQKLNQSLQKVISVGVGKWTIASLYLLGRAQKIFRCF
jgi:hypothetical protein